MTDIMSELDEILTGMGVEAEEASAPSPSSDIETITIPTRDLYVLYAWASAGHDVITSGVGKGMAAVLLQGIGCVGESFESAMEAYGDLLHAFSDRTHGYCNREIDPKDHMKEAYNLAERLDALDRQLGKPIGYWKTI